MCNNFLCVLLCVRMYVCLAGVHRDCVGHVYTCAHVCACVCTCVAGLCWVCMYVQGYRGIGVVLGMCVCAGV